MDSVEQEPNPPAEKPSGGDGLAGLAPLVLTNGENVQDSVAAWRPPALGRSARASAA